MPAYEGCAENVFAKENKHKRKEKNMKTSRIALIGLAMAAVAITAASAQDISYSSKPWLHPQRGTAICPCVAAAAAAAEAAPSVALQDYSSKSCLRPREREFEIAFFPEGATVGKPAVRHERTASPKMTVPNPGCANTTRSVLWKSG